MVALDKMAIIDTATTLEKFAVLTSSLSLHNVDKFYRRLKATNVSRKFSMFIADHRSVIANWNSAGPAALVAFVDKMKKANVTISAVARIRSALFGAAPEMERVLAKISDVIDQISGKTLISMGVRPGPEFGKRLFEERVKAVAQVISSYLEV
jgi:hypothetical protein